MKKVTILVILITLLAKLLGFAREMILASVYGVSAISDAYLFANNLPAIIFTMIATAFVNGFIPIYLETEQVKGARDANRFLNNVLHTMFVICSIICIIFFLFTPQLVKIFLPQAGGETLSYSILFSRITIVSIFFTCIYQLFQGYLQVKQSFVLPVLFSLPLNMMFVAGIYISKVHSLMWLPYSILLAYILQGGLIFFYAFKKEYQYVPLIDWKDKGVQTLLLMAGPLILGSAMDTVGQMVNQGLSSSIEGGVSYVNYGMRIGRMINGIFAPAIIGVLYPSIARYIAKKDNQSVNQTFSDSIRSILVITVPATVGLVVLAEPINRLIFLRGEFNLTDLAVTTPASAAFCLGIISLSLREIIIRIFYAHQDMKTPTINCVGTIIFQLILGMILSRYMGVTGILLSMSIASTVWLLIFFVQMRKIFSNYPWKEDIIEFIKIMISALVMGGISYGSYVAILGSSSYIVALVGSILIGGMVYLGGLLVLRVGVVWELVGLACRRFLK